MSKTIDEKVVEMRFDNKQFESNVSQSMSTLDKLKRSLNLTDAAKGLEGVSSAAKSIDMSSLSDGVHTVGLKFNALYTMADQALRNITNSAMYYGKRIVSALTIDPIKTGFSEYELKMGSVQTIMASTGESLETVNDYLGELNTYADKTIYSFSDMTSNIGKFTNAGVGLKDAVSAIKGVSNVAAVSGANASDASRAMYNFAQALSAGYVKLIDWKSIENANMATVEFKEQLLETAVSLGTVTKEADGTYKTLKGNTFNATKNFNEVLQDQWMTTDVLVQTLAKYSDETTDIGKKAFSAAQDVKTLSQLFDTLKEAAQSGWAQTWEIIVGDFEEAKKFLTEINEIVSGILDASANARNDMLENWKIMGGREDLIQSLRNSIEAISSIIKPIKEAFRDIFPPMTAEKLLAFTQGLKELTAKLIISDKTAENIKRTFKGLFAVIDIFKTIITSVFKALGLLTGSVGDLGGGLLGVTAFLGDLLVAFRDVIKSSKIFDKIFQTIAKGIKLVINIVSKLPLNFIFASLATIFENIISKIVDIGESASDVKFKVVESFSAMGNSIVNSKFFKFLQNIWTVIKKIVTGIGNVILDFANKIENANFDSFLDLVKTIMSTVSVVYIAKFVKNLASLTGTAKSFKKSLTGIMNSFKDVIGEVGDTLKSFQKKVKAEALKSIAMAIAILAGSLILISFIDKESLTDALGALTILFVEMVASMLLLNKANGINSLNLIKMGAQLVGFAIAVQVLALACKSISSMDWSQLGKAGAAIAGLALIMSMAFKLMSSTSGFFANNSEIFATSKSIAATSAQMIAFAVAIKILASACLMFADIDWSSMVKAGIALTGLTAAMVVMSKTLSGEKSGMTSLQMIGFAFAIKILASVCKDFSSMDWESLKKAGIALIGLTAGVIGLSYALNLIPEKSFWSAISLVATVKALSIMFKTLEGAASLSWEELGKMGVALAGLAAGITVLAVALRIMSWQGAIGAVGLIVAVGAIKLLVPVLKKLASMKWQDIVKGLSIIAIAFGLLGVCALVLLPVTPIILALSVAITLLGVSVLGIGTGLSLMAAGITALTVALSAGAAIIVTSLTAILTGIMNLIPLFAKKIGEGLLQLCIVIAEGAPIIAETFIELLISVLRVMSKSIPSLVEVLVDLIVNLIMALADNLPRIIEAGIKVLMAFLQGIVNALKTIDVDTLLKGLTALGIISAIIAAMAAVAVLVPAAMIGVIGMGLVVAELALVLSAIGGLAQIPGLTWIVSEGGNLLQVIGTAIGKFIGGIAGGFAEGASNSLPKIASNLSGFMANISQFIEGLKNIDMSVLKGITILSLVMSSIKFMNGGGIISFISGRFSIHKFGSNLTLLGKAISDFGNEIKDVDSNAITAAANAGKVLTEMAKSIPNSGGLISFITGDNDLGSFSKKIAMFGKAIASFSNEVKEIDPIAISSAANAGKVLIEMANTIPRSFGLFSFIFGENDLGLFSLKLVMFGRAIVAFSNEIKEIDSNVIVSAANAGKALAEMSSSIPKSGGLLSFINGESNLGKFSENVAMYGRAIASFNNEVKDINENAAVSAANAGKVLSEMASTIPNSGGLVSSIEGDNDLGAFSVNVAMFGRAISSFSKEVKDIDSSAIASAANAGKVLSEMASTIPNSGGLVSFINGDNDLLNFSLKLPIFGASIAAFSKEVKGINESAVISAVNAGKALAEMSSSIPRSWGLVSFINGENDLALFGLRLPIFGAALASFNNEVKDINEKAAVSAANAGKALAEMSSSIPKSGGLVSFINGESDLGKFSKNLAMFGRAIASFNNEVIDITESKVLAASNTGKTLAEMSSSIPKSGGLLDFINGESDLGSFSVKLAMFGRAISSFNNEVMDITESKVLAAANAGKALAEMSSSIPNSWGLVSFINGENDLTTFSDKILIFGEAITGFSTQVKDINGDSVIKAANAGKALTEMSNTIPNSGGLLSFINGKTDLTTFSDKISIFGEAISNFSNEVKNISEDSVTKAANAGSALSELSKNLPESGFWDRVFGDGNLKSFGKGIKTLGSKLKDFYDEVKNIATSKIKAAAESLKTLSDIAKGMQGVDFGSFKTFGESLSALTGIKDKYQSFYDAGSYLVTGFANGISENDYKAAAKAAAMARAAARAAEEALDENSPSKVFYGIGDYAGLGFVNALNSYEKTSYKAGTEMADSARNGLSDSINKIKDFINGDFDTQPTIRPILDLSDVKSGASAIGSMLGLGSSVGVLANVGSISSMMNNRQNGVNNDIVSAIDDLRKDLGKVGNTSYNVNGITYDDGSNIASAIKTIIQAAKVERRV